MQLGFSESESGLQLNQQFRYMERFSYSQLVC
jgi:hypothetical protein